MIISLNKAHWGSVGFAQTEVQRATHAVPRMSGPSTNVVPSLSALATHDIPSVGGPYAYYALCIHGAQGFMAILAAPSPTLGHYLLTIPTPSRLESNSPVLCIPAYGVPVWGGQGSAQRPISSISPTCSLWFPSIGRTRPLQGPCLSPTSLAQRSARACRVLDF
ncbi:hypothetical protein AMTR_s00009p00043270 [Amborella trichopoda]|uniref:Uncharacterized protein n=1 Tax=Amborella trichopoda TaxID=13333 RepID=W1NI16_AMBTC|nr:hypothetical protein AMTR_s00009p00043270 [Amborella trichopoda]